MKLRMGSYIAVFLLLFSYGNPAVAQTMTEVHHITFGHFALLNNSSAHTIVITPGNAAVYDPAIIPDGAAMAQRGEYSLSGMPPNMSLTFGVSSTNGTTTGGTTLTNANNMSLNGGGSPPLFTVGTFTANSPSTNGLGDATLYIGATLTTSGTGGNYTDGNYTGSVDITVYF